MSKLLRWPLIIAAIIIVARVVVERTGAPEAVSRFFPVFVLTLLIVPIYIGWRLARSGVERPYKQLFAMVAVYAVLVRAMVVVTYWLARIFEWPESRFAGTWGPDVDPLRGFIMVPVFTALFWIVASIFVGGGLGSLVIALARPRTKKS